jgi:hypothetical protein
MASSSTKKKGGNKHAQNSRRNERKYKRSRGKPEPGKCGSSYCSKQTGCSPWK